MAGSAVEVRVWAEAEEEAMSAAVAMAMATAGAAVVWEEVAKVEGLAGSAGCKVGVEA